MFAKQITDLARFDAVVTAAIDNINATVADSKQAALWIKGIERSVEMIETQGEFMAYDIDKMELTVWSQTSDQVYTANGSCQCLAHQNGNGRCRHRIAAKLFKNYFGLGGETRRPEAGAVVNTANIAPHPSCCSHLTDAQYSQLENHEAETAEAARRDVITETWGFNTRGQWVKTEKIGGFRI